MTHEIEIQPWATEKKRDVEGATKTVCRWSCSCGRIGPAVALMEARRARIGGARHVAAQERGR